MKNKLFRLNIAGFIFAGITGSINHFIFEWSGYSRLIGALVPVNESPWEHLKLLLIPYFIWSAAEYFILKKDNRIFFCKALGALMGMLSIIIIFYTYSGIIGHYIMFIDILSFFIGIAAAFTLDYFMIMTDKFNTRLYNNIGILILIFLISTFILFTFMPPLIPLFRDPQNLSYGI